MQTFLAKSGRMVWEIHVPMSYLQNLSRNPSTSLGIGKGMMVVLHVKAIGGDSLQLVAEV